MATKAELEAELKALREQLEEQQDSDADESDTQPSSGLDVASLKRTLADAGLAPEDIEAVWDQLSTELGNLQQKNPMLTLVGTFALGFMLGRMSK